MYVDSSPTQTRRFANTARREPAPKTADPKPRRSARRIRATDAVVSQWLLEQLPAERRVHIAGTPS